jgi:hypothetical protein
MKNHEANSHKGLFDRCSEYNMLLDSSRHYRSDMMACGAWLLEILFTNFLGDCSSTAEVLLGKSDFFYLFRENIDFNFQITFIPFNRLLTLIFKTNNIILENNIIHVFLCLQQRRLKVKHKRIGFWIFEEYENSYTVHTSTY